MKIVVRYDILVQMDINSYIMQQCKAYCFCTEGSSYRKHAVTQYWHTIEQWSWILSKHSTRGQHSIDDFCLGSLLRALSLKR